MERIDELKKIIRTLEWDLALIKDKELRAVKEYQLRLCRQELDSYGCRESS